METICAKFQGQRQVIRDQEGNAARPAGLPEDRRQQGDVIGVRRAQKKSGNAALRKSGIEIIGKMVGRRGRRADQKELTARPVALDGLASDAHASLR
jgi:hypothetical protein